MIRLATNNDTETILKIFDSAKRFMIKTNNKTQWQKNYPNCLIVEQDIKNKNCYVITENAEIVGVFSFIIGVEKTYNKIDGAWNYSFPYGTIHRLASNNKTKNIAKKCFDFCFSITPYIRIDTHKNNLPMQKAILNYGFKECGIIYVRDNSKRIAYDLYKVQK